MKTLNKVCQFLAIALGLAAIVLFFLKFATFTLADGQTVAFAGTEISFGTEKVIGKIPYDMAKSADILFCFWLTVIAFLFSIFSFKSKFSRYFVPVVGLIDGIYMLVIALSDAKKFVDGRPLTVELGVLDIKYSKFVLLTAICILAFAVVAGAYLFIDDYLEVLASKGSKKTIFRRVIAFFKDYKSEVKKIVWPGFKDVLKNTVIVLIMCLIIGLLIWGIDYGLGKLLALVLGIKS